MATLSSITSFQDRDPLSPTHFNSKLTPLLADLATLNTQLGYTINPLVAPYSAAGNGTTDDTAALQAMINANPQNVIFDGQGHTYLLSGNGLRFPAGTTRIEFRNFNFTVTGDGNALSATGLVFDCTFEHIFIVATGHTTVGRRLIDFTNFSLCTWRHVRTFGTAGKTIHWYGTGNGVGSAPYYNHWEQCYGGVGSAYLQADDTGASGGGPNANTFTASRVQMGATEPAFVLGRYTQAWSFNNVIIETAASGYSIDGISNTIRGGWLESVRTCFQFGANAICNLIDGPYISTTSSYITGPAGFDRLNAVDSLLNDLSDVALLAARKPTYYATQSATTTPPFAFSSESSLGWYRSATSTMALSYGTLNLNQVRLSSVRTIASLGSSGNGNDKEAWLTVGLSVTTLNVRSGNTTYYFASSANTNV